MDLTFQVPVQYCSLQHQTLFSPPDTSTDEHCFHLGPAVSFFNCRLLFPGRILDIFQPGGVIYRSILDIFPPGGLICWCRIFLKAFHVLCGVLQARLLEWVAISFSSGPCFVRTLHCDLSVLGDLAWFWS